ncbi:MAG: class I SAM-dependent methyltransferase [Fibrobacteres bacterium]|nr:class I SAM-dependent methyltransferase [Fibrobacterota bacterium]
MNTISAAYDINAEREWNRLEHDPFHSLEFIVTSHFLKKYLPKQGRILDAGGGPGRYSLELCRLDYEVVLADISPGLIEHAKNRFKDEPDAIRNRLIEFVVGDIQDLSFLNKYRFDAVLCLGGPLTHIESDTGRIKALSELVRIAKPNAPVFVSVMGRLAALRTILVKHNEEILDPSIGKLVEDGSSNSGFTKSTWHFYRAEELKRQAEQCGLVTLDMAGCQGVSSNLEDATNQLSNDPEKWKR